VLSEIRRRFWPNKVVAAQPGRGESKHLSAVLTGKRAIDEKPTLYICENFTCKQPVTGDERIASECERLAAAAK
jgi:uncharacterized protein YyaL (SSP411 family)